MTVETSVYVRMPRAIKEALLTLEKRATAASRRSEKLPPGDRSEAIRFDALHTAIDQLASAAMAAGEPYIQTSSTESVAQSAMASGVSIIHPDSDVPPDAPSDVLSWLAAGSLVVELRLPHQPGSTALSGDAGKGPPPPARRWRSVSNQPREAMRERFTYLLAEALNSNIDDASIQPSGITNSILTETLRLHAAAIQHLVRVELPVRYVDSSSGPPFSLRAVPLVQRLPEGWRRLRFTLLSIRHVEMDPIVHGAWLRNSRVSIRRPQGLTDQIAYETSKRQLLLLNPRVPTIIQMYQTGFEPAIVGFYRAVVHHMLEYPRSIAVAPYYFQARGNFTEGTPWVME